MINEKSQQFLIEEYKNIAHTHDQLRNNIFMLFNYFLIASALPVTILNLVSKISDPAVQHLTGMFFLVVSLGDILLACSMIEAKLRQYTYARAVNLIRKSFSDFDNGLKEYLSLPCDKNKPDFKDLGSSRYLVIFMFVVAVTYLSLGLYFFKLPISLIIILAIVSLAVLFYLQRKLVCRYIKKHVEG